MNVSFTVTILFLFLILSLQLSCLNDADRKNPLDPRAQGFESVGAVSGETLTFYSPFAPLSTVEVHMEPGSFASTTDTQGRFVFDNVPEGNYQVLAMKEGYAAVTLPIQVDVGKTTDVVLNLDGLPLVRSFSVNSCHISRLFPERDLFLLEVAAELNDPDGTNDIDLVQMEIPGMSFLDTLQLSLSIGTFVKEITESQILGNNLQDVLGLPIILRARDKAGFEMRSTPIFLARIIEKKPLTNAPKDLETVDSPTPLLTWEAMLDLDFVFTYKVDLFRIDFAMDTRIWSQTAIDASITSITVPDSLVQGNYFWTVSVVDEFGNWSRSKEASFRVE